MTGEAGLVELDKIDPRDHEGPELGVDNRDQRAGHGRPIGIDRSPVNAASQCEWAGHGDFDRAARVLPEPSKFGHGAEAVGRSQWLDRAIAVALVVSGSTQAPEPRSELEPAEIFVETQVEIDPLHSPSVIRSRPARRWSSIARRMASRTASSRSAGPNKSGWAFTSAMNFSNQPGNDQLPITVVGSTISDIVADPLLFCC